MSIEDNIEARREADEMHILASEIVIGHNTLFALTFWRRMLENVCAVLPDKYHSKKIVKSGMVPMSDEEVKKFGDKVIDFGTHKGEKLRSVPLDYLLWLDSQGDFKSELKRYLASESIQKEQPDAL